MELLCLEKEGEPNSVADPVFLGDDRVLSNLLFLEKKYRLKESYFETIQKDLTASMRKEVSIWLLEVCMEEQCEEEVFSTAMCIMDRFLSQVFIQKSQLQLLAATCLLLSSKLVQNKLVSTERLVMFTDYSVTCEEIRSWEYLVLGALNWDIHAVVPNHFLDLILHRLTFVDANKRTMLQKHAELFISLCASEFQFFSYLPSVIASACLALVLDIHCYKENSNEILDCIQEIIKIDTKTIEETIDLLEDLVPSNRFHSTKNQSKRKRKNKNRPLINLNNDSDSDLEQENSNVNNNLCSSQPEVTKSGASSQTTNAMKYTDSSNQNLNNIASNKQQSELEQQIEKTHHYCQNINNTKNSNSNLSYQQTNSIECSNRPCSSLIEEVDSEAMILSDALSSQDEDEEIVLLDLTCFEKPQPICKMMQRDCFTSINDVPGVLF